jgi:hypothetical protein
MSREEIEASKMFHEVSDRLEALNKEFSKFNAKEPHNIDSKVADDFRKKLVDLEAEASNYFEKFV